MGHHLIARTELLNTSGNTSQGTDSFCLELITTAYPIPQISTPDYFLWGYLKDSVYENNPETKKVLKGNIRREIRQIPKEMFNRVVDNFNVRVSAVIQQHSDWIERIFNY